MALNGIYYVIKNGDKILPIWGTVGISPDRNNHPFRAHSLSLNAGPFEQSEAFDPSLK